MSVLLGEAHYPSLEVERSFDELAKGVTEGTIPRSKALKSVGAAILGGMLSIFALPPRDADAARRRLLKTLWAVVNINADQTITVTRSKGVTGSSKLGAGVYKIRFNRNVSGCACVATIGQSQVGFISAQAGSFVATGREVVVSTYDSDGTAAERPFQLVVHC